MAKSLSAKTIISCKINGAPQSFVSNEVPITLNDASQKQVERKSIPYSKKELYHRPHTCACKNICGLLLAFIMKIFQ